MSLKSLTIDTSAWQNKSAEWHELRQAKWPIIEKWFERYWVEWSSFPKGEETTAYHHYYLTGEIDVRFKNWEYLTLLHPTPSVPNIRQLIQLHGSDYYGPGFHTGETYYPLITLGVVEPQTLDNIFIAFAGNNYDETAQLRNFDPVEQVAPMLEKLLPKISSWFQIETPDQLPIELLIPYLKSVIKYVTPETFDDAEFRLNAHFKKLSRFQSGRLPKRLVNPERPIKLVQEFRDYYLSNQVDTCVKECAQQYFS